MARKQTAAQRRASLRNLKRARAARKGPVRKRRRPVRRRNPIVRRATAKKRRSTAYRKRAPSRRRYGYAKSRSRVVRANQPKFLKGFGGITGKLTKAATDAGWALAGKATVNYAAGMLPFPRDGMMGTGVKLLTAFAVTTLAKNFKIVSTNGAHMMLVGSVMGILEPYAKMVPILGPALGESLPMGSYLGEYGGGGEVYGGDAYSNMGAYVEPEMGEELPMGEYMFV